MGGGGVAARVPYYRGVRGSASLATRPLDAPALAAEALEPGEMRRVPYAGELLGAIRVRASFAAIPLDAFDRACATLEAEEQAAYLHLLRLSVAEGRNWCRLAKRELMDRLRLSERRLLRVLGALVEKGFARPLHRDNRGTLWRVYLPSEAAGEPLGDDVIAGRAGELRLVRPARTAATPVPITAVHPERSADAEASARSRRATSTTTTTTRPRAVHSDAALSRALASARGLTGPEAIAAALREVKDLLAEGQRPERIAACIETVRRRAERAAHTGEAP